MAIKILAVGKIQPMYRGIQEEFQKRLLRYCKFEIFEVPDEQAPEKLSEAQREAVMLAEWEKLNKKIKDTDFVVALDSHGKKFSSVEFSKFIGEIEGRTAVFILGGSLGLHPLALKRANALVSLSDRTFTHSMARTIIIEQIYRSFKIIKNEPYHK